MEISFYHLTTSPIEKALPALVDKAYEAGNNVLVVASEENVKVFDDTFWTFAKKKFLPHGTPASKHEPAKNPIFITAENDNANNAEILAIADGREVFGDFKRVLDVFDGNIDADLDAARTRWKQYKEAGHDLRYWFQDEKGKWQEKQI